MDILLEHLTAYVDKLSTLINPLSLVTNIILCTLLNLLVASFYVRYGNAISNRKRFAANFVPLSLTTMAIMMIVAPSAALGLGLVGALSIIRFRAAIKDPEELTYLFLSIGIGLATGADQPLIAIIIILFVLIFLWVSKKLGNAPAFVDGNRMYVNISTDINDIMQIEAVLKTSFKEVALKRVDTLHGGLDLSFVCKSNSIQQIQEGKDKLLAISDYTQISIIDQPDLII